MSDSLRPAAAGEPPAGAPGASAGAWIARSPCARFTDESEREGACEHLTDSMALVIRLEAASSARGRLSDVIDEAIERQLDARGAAPPGIGSSSDADAALSDQLFRARRVGATGIALALGPLRAATSARGAIEPEDSATLRFWARATSDRPVWLLLDASDAATPAYADPVALGDVLEATPGPPRAVGAPASSESSESADLADGEPAPTDPTPPVAPNDDAVEAPSPPPPVIIKAFVSAIASRVAPPTALPARHSSGAAIAAADDAWRAWTLALAAAHGPQPLAAFERLFAHDYLPLMNAIAEGLDEPRALHAHDEFRRTFARAYTDACPTFAVTGKRPRMVLDAPDVAARIARLHGARATQVLLVDAMRFDVGARVKENLRRALGARASLTDELILWSALPTVTARQLEALHRGVDALRSSQPDADREGETLRGRSAEVIRRLRIGSRELYKLDIVEARVRDLAAAPRASSFAAELDAIADAAAETIARHAQTLKPRTLLFVFGDHGFTFDRSGQAQQGGASPEEVLVPAFALLVGDVH